MKRVLTGVLGVCVISVAAMAAENVADSPEAATPLAKGASVPDVSLKTVDGEDVKLREVVAEKPAALIFYRGGWCPYCTKHLKDLREIEDEMREAGYQIIAISPDDPAHLKKTLDQQDLPYTLMSDSKMEAARSFGLAFRLDGDTLERYKGFGIDLADASGGGNRDALPVPAFYLVNKEGEITFAHTDADYKKRLSNAEILKAL
jgi:peroxiredoxin